MLLFFWSFQPPSKPLTAYSAVGKPDTAYSAVQKPDTPYAAVGKPDTLYRTNPDLANGVTLDSNSVTLNSLTVYLHGYTTATPPGHNTKANAAYTRVSKNPTTYT